MFLLVSNERDITTDYIVLECERRGLPFVRLNSERLPDAKVLFTSKSDTFGWMIEKRNTVIDFSTVTAAYFRRPGTPSIAPTGTDPAVQQYIDHEWGAALSSALNSLESRWLNSPLAILAAEDKPRQLELAQAVGFLVPDTVITNDINSVQSLMDRGPIIAKPLRQALLSSDNEEKVIFTTRIESLTDNDAYKVAAAPAIYQMEIPKKVDIRATVVANSVYAAEIDSQNNEQTQVDWRRSVDPDTPHSPHNLPSEVQKKCVELVLKLDLRFAALDLILDPHGHYWFLEANPNGQWAWIENRTRLPLTSAITDELYRISTQQ